MPEVEVDGLSFNYELRGEGDTLLLVHGLGSSILDWQEQIDFFAKDYQVIAIDVRGHGRSGKPAGPYELRQFAEDFIKVLDQLGLVQFHVVGISMGGMIAFELALMAPERVRSMTVVNSGPAVVARNWRERLALWYRSLLLKITDMRKMGELLAPRLFPGEEHNEKRAQMIERWAANDKKAYSAAYHAIIGWSVYELIHTIQCPTLIVAADKDYTPVALKQEYMKQIPTAELAVIKDSHHAVTGEKPEEFNRILADFLTKHFAPKASVA